MPAEFAPAVHLPRSPEPTYEAAAEVKASSSRPFPTEPLLAGLWLLGVTLMLARLALGWHRLHRICRLAVPVGDPKELSHKSCRRARVLVSELVKGPVCFGVFHPTIILPRQLYEGSRQEELRMVLGHELAHVERRDCLVNLFQRLLESTLFFHPLVWFASRQLSREREQVCDNWALSRGAQAHAYARLLSRLAEWEPSGYTGLQGLALFEGNLLRRVRTLLDPRNRRLTHARRLTAVVMAAAALAIFLTFGTVKLTEARPPEKPSVDEVGEDAEGWGEVVRRVTDRAAGARAEEKPKSQASFERLTVVLRSNWWQRNRVITIRGDGSYDFELQETVEGGGRYRASYRLKPEHLRQLDELLKATQWLARPGFRKDRGLEDGVEYALTVVRGGKESTVVCYGDQPRAYAELIRFLRRIDRQEWLHYLATAAPEGRTLDAAREIAQELESIREGRPRLPARRILDYHRFVPTFTEWVRHPEGRHREELKVALDLLAFLHTESERDSIAALRYYQDTTVPYYLVRSAGAMVRAAAVRALVELGGKESLEAIAAVQNDEEVEVRAAVVEGLLELQGVESIPTLKKMFPTTNRVAWALIRLGPPAAPTIAEIIGSPPDPNDARHHELVRTYLRHWEELPGPIDRRVIAAVSKSVQARQMQSWPSRQYHERLLWLLSVERSRGSRLEFRIVPNQPGSDRGPIIVPQVFRGYLGSLVAKGPQPGPDSSGYWQWFEHGDEALNLPFVGTYQGRRYALLCALWPWAMFSHVEGPGAWGLKKVYATQDTEGQPALGLEFDENGSKLFAAFTKKNVGNTMAVLVGGKVISAAVIKARISSRLIITGRFLEEQVRDLVNALTMGMPPVWPPPPPLDEERRRETEQGSRKPVRARKPLGEGEEAPGAGATPEQARDRADRMRGEYEARYPPGTTSPEEARDFEIVASTFQQVIEKYAGTDIEAYCRFGLAGLYQYRGDYKGTIKQIEKVARRFAGTEHEMEAYLSLGLTYLQGYHDPQAAIPWFEKVRFPGGVDRNAVAPPEGPEYSRGYKLYLSAQESMARCDAALGKFAPAWQRYEELMRRYPQYKSSLAMHRRWTLRAALSKRCGDRKDRIQKEVNRLLAALPTLEGEEQANAAILLEVAGDDYKIIAGMCNVEKMPNANEILRPGYLTRAEAAYESYIRALMNQSRWTDSTLGEMTSRSSGNVRYCLVIARGKRSDRTAREGILKILRDPEAGIMRAWAAEGLGVVGRAEDLPLLREIAESDPLECERQEASGQLIKNFFPVREAAARAIKAIEARIRKEKESRSSDRHPLAKDPGGRDQGDEEKLTRSMSNPAKPEVRARVSECGCG